MDVNDQNKLLTILATNQEVYDRLTYVRVTDFTTPVARFIYDIVSRFKTAHGMLPSLETIASEAISAMNGTSESTYMTVPDKSMAQAVAETLGLISAGVCPSEVIRVTGMVSDHLFSVRMQQVERIAQDQGLSAQKKMDLMAEARDELRVATGNSAKNEFISGMEELTEDETVNMTKVATGISQLDDALAGGLSPEEGNLAILVAQSGLGKTTGLINFAAHNIKEGQYALFMTLENSERLIRQRLQSIIGNFNIRMFKTPRAKWPKDVAERYKAMVSSNCGLFKRISITDKSSEGPMKLSDIDGVICRWKDMMMRNGVPEDKLVAVYIDWLMQIDTRSAPGVGKDSRGDLPATNTMKELGAIARRNKVVIWTAQQANRSGQGKEILKPSDIADATAIQNYVDLGISFGLAPDAQAAAMSMDGSEKSVGSDTDRLLTVGCFKARNASIAGKGFKVYQCPSLKLWNSKNDWVRTLNHLKDMDPNELYSQL